MSTNYTLDGITLPGDLKWTDEFTWSRFRQSRRRSLTGADIRQESLVSGGRPITLVTTTDGDRVYGPVERSLVNQLRALEETIPDGMTLETPDGRTFTVVFRAEGDTAVEAEQLLFLSPALDTDWYALTLRLMEL